MKRTLIETITKKNFKIHEDNLEVKLQGWVHRVRKMKSIVFIILRDRTGLVQLTISPSLFEQYDIQNESVIEVTGEIVNSNNKISAYELRVSEIDLLCSTPEELPVQVNADELNISLDTLLNHRVLTLRHPAEAAIFKIQAALTEGFSIFLRKESFTEIRTPKLVKEGAEGGSNVFQLNYFDQMAYLAQSPQFYKQMMVASGFERVFEIGPVFRAESHSTSRHLNEYVSLDLEMGFITSENELMELETNLLKCMIEHVQSICSKELETLNVTLPIIPDSIPSMKLSEAIEILKHKYEKTELEGDLDPEGEKLIAKHVLEETGSDFLFLTHYPQSKRPMYTMPCGEYETHSFDLLYKGLEITTGGLRIHQTKMLIENMIKKGLNPESYTSYIQTFTYGAPPHGGLAIGLERLTAQLLGFSNVRRTALFPRDCSRLTP